MRPQYLRSCVIRHWLVACTDVWEGLVSPIPKCNAVLVT
jgi:hypothetical protein